MGTLVADLASAGTGINHAVRGIVRTPEGEIEAFVKRLEDSREILVECVCAILARRLGLPVPEPLLVLVPDYLGGPGLAFGSAAVSHPNLQVRIQPNGQAAVFERLRKWKDLVRAACFDEWIANCDRHAGNLLYDGDAEFWLIDHGLAIHEQIPADALAPNNQLFALAISGLTEGDLLTLRPQALGVMEGYAEHDAIGIKEILPSGFWSSGLRSSVLIWLEARQSHLMRFGSARVPTQQMGLFHG